MVIGKFVNNGNIYNQLTKNTYTDGGLDLKCDLSKTIDVYSAAGHTIIEDPELDEIIIPPFSRIVVNTSINIAIPEGYVGLIWDRSGLAAKYGITILAGCIDAGYVGDVKIVMFNSSYDSYIVRNNDRVAQLLTVFIVLDKYEEVDSLDKTIRGTAGFGSSGV